MRQVVRRVVRVLTEGCAQGEEEADEQFKFVRGVFHPGAFGLIDEDEMEFLGFVESFALDAAGVVAVARLGIGSGMKGGSSLG